MVTNILDYMYEGYGYDTNDQRLNTIEQGVELREQNTEDGYTTEGMKTFAAQGIFSYDDAIDTPHANKYTQVGQFKSENGANYTELRPPLCGCGD